MRDQRVDMEETSADGAVDSCDARYPLGGVLQAKDEWRIPPEVNADPLVISAEAELSGAATIMDREGGERVLRHN